MFNALLKGIFNMVIGLVQTLLSPIDLLLANTLPAFNQVLVGFGNFLTYILRFIPWVLSWFHIPTFLLTFLVYYIIAKITISQAIHLVKLALAWWRTLVP